MAAGSLVVISLAVVVELVVSNSPTSSSFPGTVTSGSVTLGRGSVLIGVVAVTESRVKLVEVIRTVFRRGDDGLSVGVKDRQIVMMEAHIFRSMPKTEYD